ncbi:MAG: helix-turn-helix domain-containing protein [Propionibacteriaceae bacterium]
MPPRIQASWRRCAERGLASDSLEVPHNAEIDTDSALLRLATPVLRALQASLADEPVSVMLSEADGTVVGRFCADRAILTALDEVALAPGSTFSEAAVGTNGFGLALVDDRASLVQGREHYSEPLSTFTCAGTPVHDPVTGQVVGALSLTTWSMRRHDLLMALASQTAMNIEARMASESGAHSVRQLDGYLRAIADRRDGNAGTAGPRLSALEQLEREALVDALSRCGGRVTEAAVALGLSRATAYRRLRHYRIDLTAF